MSEHDTFTDNSARINELEKKLRASKKDILAQIIYISVQMEREEYLEAKLAESIPKEDALLLFHKFKAVRDEYKTATTSEVCNSIRFEAKIQFELMKQVVNSFEKLLTNHKE